MPQSNLVVVDARPSRESQHFATFRRQAFWRLLTRNNVTTQGSLTGKGYLVPTYIADHLAAGIAMEDAIGVFGTTASATVGQSMLSNIPYFFPVNGVGLTVPVQTMAATIVIGAASNGAGSYPVIDAVTLELVKVNAAGTVTSIVSQTLSPAQTITTTGTTFVTVPYQFAMNIASLVSVAATDRLALRLSLTAHALSGVQCYFAPNATGAGANTTTGTTSGTTTYAASYVALEVY